MIVVQTSDGSSTIVLQESGLTYHSRHGAIQESQHIFIDAGLKHFIEGSEAKDLHIFEMGFGTGLNCLLTFAATIDYPASIFYSSIDLHPVPETIYKQLNYCQLPALAKHHDVFINMHHSPWHQQVMLSTKFLLEKIQADITGYAAAQHFDIIYFDAFSQESSPDQWSEAVFTKLYHSLKPGGILVTYSSKVVVRRAMEAAGFKVQKIPGPHGKREIVRAIKQN